MKKLLLTILFSLLFIGYAEACSIYVTTTYNKDGNVGVMRDEYVCVIKHEIIGDTLIIICPNKKIIYNLKNVQKIEYVNCGG